MRSQVAGVLFRGVDLVEVSAFRPEIDVGRYWQGVWRTTSMNSPSALPGGEREAKL